MAVLLDGDQDGQKRVPRVDLGRLGAVGAFRARKADAGLNGDMNVVVVPTNVAGMPDPHRRVIELEEQGLERQQRSPHRPAVAIGVAVITGEALVVVAAW
jgi:hypothetical protein